MSVDHPAADLADETLQHLQGRQILSLAAMSPSGAPHAATFVYVNDGLTIYFASQPDSRTAHYIRQNPSVAFTIDGYFADWTTVNRIQAAGECLSVTDSAEVARVAELFQQKFPTRAQPAPGSRAIFRITPTEVYFIKGNSGADDGEDLTSYRPNLVHSVFDDRPVTALGHIEAKLESMHVETGEVIVHQGGPADRFFVVVDGAVEISHESSGSTRSLTVLRGGEFFGEIAILRNTPRTATATALLPTTLLTMDRQTFRNLVGQALGASEDFGTIIRERLQRSQSAQNSENQ
jgi:nitroimidazol reductase NimA-like FMN-containing flavoprotein (pyridoxamine 5'-phosphate oxidase superfamily)